jgi:cytosine/uracil/thiamine/allantoin permease
MNDEEIVELNEDVSASPLYSEDLAPVPKNKRTWSVWSLTALWVGMAVCIPTYLMAALMINSGMGWLESLIIIGLANIIITIPMVLNGHAGVKYGIPFPVVGRSSFGTKGVHIPSLTRAIVACGWFGIQTWIGGLAIYAIAAVLMGFDATAELTPGTFFCFIIFWFINMFFIWKGTDSIKWLEEYSAPILILISILLLIWGANTAGGFGIVLDQDEQLKKPSATLTVDSGKDRQLLIQINPLTDKTGKNHKAQEYQMRLIEEDKDTTTSTWKSIEFGKNMMLTNFASFDSLNNRHLEFRVRNTKAKGQDKPVSSWIAIALPDANAPPPPRKLWSYIFWLTIMLGFWATMSLSIADITRYAPSQKTQVKGQFLGLPGTMMLFSFVAIFVTCAAVINFDSILIRADVPMDPVSLLSQFTSPWVVIVSQIFMIIATLSTNIAANVIAPSNAFANLIPSKITFKSGGTITGIIGIIICPWWLMDDISNLLIMVSGFLGPVLGIMLCDYFLIRKKQLALAELYKTNGIYSGFNSKAMIALVAGVVLALVWSFVPALAFLSSLAWFTGFISAFGLYYVLMAKEKTQSI